nr:unnamed protein product [Digitaria exilis]
MMLPEGHGLYLGHPDLHGFARFFNLSTGAFVRSHLPLLDYHVVLDSIDGLLLLCRDGDAAVCLLHPFTGDVVDLTPLVSLLPKIELPYWYIEEDWHNEQSKRSGLMSARASVAVVGSSGKRITAMLAFDLLHRVAYAATTPKAH